MSEGTERDQAGPWQMQLNLQVQYLLKKHKFQEVIRGYFPLIESNSHKFQKKEKKNTKKTKEGKKDWERWRITP